MPRGEDDSSTVDAGGRRDRDARRGGLHGRRLSRRDCRRYVGRTRRDRRCGRRRGRHRSCGRHGCGGDRRLRRRRHRRRGRSRRPGRRGRRHHLRRRREHGQKAERIEVPLVVGRGANAEVHVWHVELRGAARPDRADDRSLVDARVARNGDRAEMRQADGEPLGRLDRDRLAVRRHGAGEAHDAGCGREHGSARIGADRDAAVLARGVRVRAVEREGLEHRTAHGPRPRGRGQDEQGQKSDRDEPPHATPPPLLSDLRTVRGHASNGAGCCQF